MKARIRFVRWEAEDILSFRLEPLAGESFPSFTAGAHVEIALKSGLSRSYSLLNDPDEVNAYEIGVHLSPDSRGGSKHIHEYWRAGDVVEISEPRNHFPIDESASFSILIGGGIGITPMLAMAARLTRLGKPWKLFYATRTRARAAFMDRMVGNPNVVITIDDEPDTPRLDLLTIIRSAPAQTHFYCCGPTGMLSAFRELGEHLGNRLHYEYFATDKPVATDGGYQLQLQRSGKLIEVKQGETMLDALLGAGIDVGFACFEGVCGSCRVPVLDGIPDHRDQFLSQDEKNANSAVMTCCSGARSSCLTLDI
jgi:ferredoxin-NADP reductase